MEKKQASLPLWKQSFEEILAMKSSISLKKTFYEEFSSKKQIGKGSFGRAFEVTFASNKAVKYAAKEISTTQNSNTQSELLQEKLILQKLSESTGFPRVFNLIKKDENELLIMSLLGQNLGELLKTCGNKFSLKTTLMIGIQALQRLESLHEKGYLHRDIKPENFTIGTEYSDNLIYMIDFGLSESYLNKEGNHVKFTNEAGVAGTPYYLSVYGHLKLQPSRRDDLISLGYMLLHMHLGRLPWYDFKKTTIEEDKMQVICQKKATSSPKELCKGLHENFTKFFEYILKLPFHLKPDYGLLINLFQGIMEEKKIENDGLYDWVALKRSKGIDLSIKRVLHEPLTKYMRIYMTLKMTLI